MKNRIKKKRLYANLAAVLSHTSVKELKGMLGRFIHFHTRSIS
jgi:hypothetical protein